MQVHTRNPLLRVTLVTKLLGEIVQGTPLWNTLHASVIECTTTKRMGEIAGSFQLSLLPKRLPPSPLYQADATWSDVLQPGDYVEISMWVPPRQPERPTMRGFVDLVGKQFSIADGRPQRVIAVGGRDYGMIPLITKLYHIEKGMAANVEIFKQWADAISKIFGWNQNDPDALPDPEAEPLAPGQTSAGPVFKPAEMMAALWQMFCEPQQELVRFSFPGANRIPVAQIAPLVDDWENFLDCVDPRTFPRAVEPLMDLWAIMADYQHAPWRELFFEEQPDKPLLVYRPAPWLDRHGNYVQPPAGWSAPGIPNTVALSPEVTTVEVPDTSIVDSALVRSVANVKNFFFSYIDLFAWNAALSKTLGAAYEGAWVNPFRGNPWLVGAEGTTAPLDSDFRKFGIRLYEARTQYRSWAQDLYHTTLSAELVKAREQGLEGNVRLVRAFDHGEHLENGTLTLKGDERLRIGQYLKLMGPEGQPRYYVEGVTQHFRQGTQPSDGRFVTQVEVSRGRGYLVRAYGEPG